MKVELTEKEVKKIGSSRYLTDYKVNTALAIAVSSVIISTYFMANIEGKINEYLRQGIGIVIIVCGCIRLFYLGVVANKEAKLFLEKCKKEDLNKGGV
jgi:hypothetical protein